MWPLSRAQRRQERQAIFHAQHANALLLPLAAAFVIFTLATLLEAIAAFGGTGFAYSVDMRHYYYQWKICDALARYFAIIVKSKPTFGDDRERIFLPNVLWATEMLVPWRKG